MELIDLFLTKFYKDFQEYTYKNKVLVAASGFAIGIATTDLLKSIITDIINICLYRQNNLNKIYTNIHKYIFD